MSQENRVWGQKVKVVGITATAVCALENTRKVGEPDLFCGQMTVVGETAAHPLPQPGPLVGKAVISQKASWNMAGM